MRVLLTVHQFFPDFGSGTEVLALSVAKDLMRRGHEVRVLTALPGAATLPDQARFDEYEYEGLRIHRFLHAHVPMGGQTSRIEISFDNRLATEYFRKLLVAFRPDVVHFFHLNRLGTGLIPAAVDAEIPAFLTPTDFWTICPMSQLAFGNGRHCDGPSPHAGNCVLHLASTRLSESNAWLLERVPAVVGDALVRMTCADWLPNYPRSGEVKAMRRRLGVNIARLNMLNRIVVPNRMMEQALLNCGVAPEKFALCAYGIDPMPTDRQLPRVATGGPLRIGFIGTLSSHKGCHVLIEAFKALPQGAARLAIHGSEKDFKVYADRLRQLAGSDPAIEFRGAFPRQQIGDVLAELDVLVVPSLWNENTPLVILAAQAAACPVVGSDVPGISAQVRDGIDGVLFEPGNSEALALRLRQMMDAPDRLAKMRANARPPKSTGAYVDELLALWQPDSPVLA
jgi:glycosyltransferase involved in cell wall biosynthesis